MKDFRPASSKQIGFIERLAAERKMEVQARNLSISDASALIKKLLDTPVPGAPAEGLDITGIPSGRYAVEGAQGMEFYKVDNLLNEKGRWNGWMFVKRQSSDFFVKAGSQRPNQRYQGSHTDALEAIMRDPKAASVLYGKSLGVCGVCGRTLTDPESIEKGIGPVCESRF